MKNKPSATPKSINPIVFRVGNGSLTMMIFCGFSPFSGVFGVDEENSNIGLVPNMTSPVSDVVVAKAVNKLVDMLEDLEDTQDVYTNMETTDEVDAALEAEG